MGSRAEGQDKKKRTFHDEKVPLGSVRYRRGLGSS